MKGYELLYIVGSQFTEAEIEEIRTNVAGLIEKAEGKVVKTENLGKIRLAYPIKKISHGTYVLVYFDAEPGALADLNRRLGLMDEVLRHTILERPANALERTFEIDSYIAPLSEEAKASRDAKRASKPAPKKTESKKAESTNTEEPKEIAPPAPADAEEAKMSMKELDQKLDTILEGNSENI